MAIEKVIDIQVKSNADQAEKSIGSLKSQLREAQAEVASLSDKFGATSFQAVEAAKNAAILKDKIGDAKALTEAFNPDAKFKAVSSSLAGVANGFAAYQGALGLVGVQSKDLEQQLLKVQSAMAIAQGLQGLGEARDSFKQLKAVGVNAFNAIKTAIGSTGIGLIVIAAGAIYAYWDDIKEAVSGVSSEQKKLNALSQKNVDQQNEKLKSIGQSDNILKLQGKSEKEILNIKIQQTDEAITANKINQENQKINTKLATEGAKRNYEMLKSFIDFVSIPQRYLYETAAKSINKVIDLINKIPGVEIKGKIDEKFAENAADYITKIAFDPEKTKAEGEATVAATQDTIQKLLNDRAGYQLNKNSIDKTASDTNKQNQIKLNEESNKEAEDFFANAKEKSDQYEADLKIQQENKLAILEEGIAAITEVEDQAANDKKAKEDKIAADKKAADEKDIEFQKNKDSVIAASKQNLNNIIAGLEASGLNKSKAGQAISKAIALTQIGIDSAVAISKASTLANAEGVAAQLAFPLVPGIGTIARVVSYAATAATVIGNIARAKQLLSGGGGGSAPSGGGGGSAVSGGASTPPSFNVVGASGTNQLAQSIGAQQQQPIQAYVVANNVTTAQALNRNIIESATIGG